MNKLRNSVVIVSLLFVFAHVSVMAQLPSSPIPSQGTLATQLPLLGSGFQNGSVIVTQSPVPGITTSINTLNTSVQTSGSYAGSIDGTVKTPSTGKISFGNSIRQGLDYNLGVEGIAQAMRQAQAQTKVARSSLLPNLTATASETEQQIDLRVAGIQLNSSTSTLSIPNIVGPFNYFDLRVHLAQNIGDLTAWNNYKSAEEIARSNGHAIKASRDLVVLAVGGSYLQALAAKSRLMSAQAQLNTAKALYEQASQQRGVGLVAQTDVNRSHIQMLVDQERLELLRKDLARQKINLARMIGLPPNDQFELSDDIPYSAAPAISFEDALQQAYNNREDLKASSSQVRASQLSRSAAHAELLPSLAINADYGATGINPNQSHGTFSATASLAVPIWRGGRTQGDIEQADAVYTQRKAELDDLHSKIESDIRNTYLDLQTASNQITVANENLKINRESLELTRQRFQAGVGNNVEVVQAQESLANAEIDYINSVLAYNIAKLTLACAMGGAEARLPQFLKVP